MGRPLQSQLLSKSCGQDCPGQAVTRTALSLFSVSLSNSLSSRLRREGSVQSSVTGQMKPWAKARALGCHWNHE